MNEDNSEALNNLISSIQEKMEGSKSNDTFSSNVSSNNSNDSTTNSSSGFNFDPSILLKAQNIFGAMNSNDNKKNLLLSLKPFLRKTRQDRMNEYINIMNVISILGNFRGKKGSD